ncbi:MAG: DUF3014 domain-containing protein [Thermoanaerobaculales bacterium]|nr:DUF3014 domain-containing protein [Thermoanaerobaculales bacterium]
MSGIVRILIGVAVVLLLIAVGVFLYFSGTEPEVREVTPPVVEDTPPAPTPTLGERLSERLQGTTLEGSDEVVRELAAILSENPQLAKWLVNDDLVRRFVASVHNVADGKNPRTHLDFLRPKKQFAARERGGQYVVNPRSFARYDLVAEVFTSLDTTGTVELFTELEPLIDEAHREIAPPNSEFRATLGKAIDRLLAVPVLTVDELLEPKVVTYRYADETLENLSSADRQFLRMGPANVAKIQAKLRELKIALEL